VCFSPSPVKTPTQSDSDEIFAEAGNEQGMDTEEVFDVQPLSLVATAVMTDTSSQGDRRNRKKQLALDVFDFDEQSDTSMKGSKVNFGLAVTSVSQPVSSSSTNRRYSTVRDFTKRKVVQGGNKTGKVLPKQSKEATERKDGRAGRGKVEKLMEDREGSLNGNDGGASKVPGKMARPIRKVKKENSSGGSKNTIVRSARRDAEMREDPGKSGSTHAETSAKLVTPEADYELNYSAPLAKDSSSSSVNSHSHSKSAKPLQSFSGEGKAGPMSRSGRDKDGNIAVIDTVSRTSEPLSSGVRQRGRRKGAEKTEESSHAENDILLEAEVGHVEG